MNEYIPVSWEELVEHMKQELLQTAQVAAAIISRFTTKKNGAHLM